MVARMQALKRSFMLHLQLTLDSAFFLADCIWSQSRRTRSIVSWTTSRRNGKLKELLRATAPVKLRSFACRKPSPPTTFMPASARKSKYPKRSSSLHRNALPEDPTLRSTLAACVDALLAVAALEIPNSLQHCAHNQRQRHR